MARNISQFSQKKKEKKKKKEKRKEKHRASMSTLDSQSTGDTDTGDNMSTTSSVPKLMLKLNSPRPNTPDTHKKMFQRTKPDDFEFPSPSSHDANPNRDPSPELVRISPLVTRPPKQKPSSEYCSCIVMWSFEFKFLFFLHSRPQFSLSFFRVLIFERNQFQCSRRRQ